MNAEFTKINDLKTVHKSGAIIELSFIKIKLTKDNKIAQIPVETYSTGSNAAMEKEYAADIFLSALKCWEVEDKSIPMTAQEINEVKSIVKGALDFWKFSHKLM